MKNYLYLILSILCCKDSFSQSVKVLEKYSKHEKLKFSPLELLDSNADLSSFSPIASLEGRAKKSESGTIEKVFLELRNEANDLGANAYRIDSVLDKKVAFIIYFTIYNLSKAELSALRKPHSANTVFIFGEFDKFLGKAKPIINGKRIIIEPLHYLSIPLADKEELTINSMGSILDDNVKLVGSKNRQVQYLKIGKEVKSNSYAPFGSGGTGINGSITNLELDLGHFLIQVLYPAKGE